MNSSSLFLYVAIPVRVSSRHRIAPKKIRVVSGSTRIFYPDQNIRIDQTVCMIRDTTLLNFVALFITKFVVISYFSFKFVVKFVTKTHGFIIKIICDIFLSNSIFYSIFKAKTRDFVIRIIYKIFLSNSWQFFIKKTRFHVFFLKKKMTNQVKKCFF